MFRLQVLNMEQMAQEGYINKVTALDQSNQAAVVDGAEKPNEPLHRDFCAKAIFILALTKDNHIAGYLECIRGKQEAEDITPVMQVDKRIGQSLLISQLLLQAKKDYLRQLATKG